MSIDLVAAYNHADDSDRDLALGPTRDFALHTFGIRL
jgi:hypothetical protein